MTSTTASVRDWPQEAEDEFERTRVLGAGAFLPCLRFKTLTCISINRTHDVFLDGAYLSSSSSWSGLFRVLCQIKIQIWAKYKNSFNPSRSMSLKSLSFSLNEAVDMVDKVTASVDE
jgi:hypothetical protein